MRAFNQVMRRTCDRTRLCVSWDVATPWSPMFSRQEEPVPPDAATGTCETPRLFRYLPKWKNETQGYFHGRFVAWNFC
jgi:hypothetical protein